MVQTDRKVVRALILFVALFTASVHAQTPTRDGLRGVVVKSDSRKAGGQFTFANLGSTHPFVTFPSGHGDETMKVFDDNELIVLIYVAHLTGSTETFYLSKSKGRFTLIEVGALEATVRGTDFRPMVTFGTLQ